MPIESERRRHPRALRVGANAIVLARGYQTATFTVEDVSEGGARIVGGLRLAVGERIKIMFNIEAHPVTLSAQVLRVNARRDSADEVAICFHDVTISTTERIRGFVLQIVATQRSNAFDEEPTEIDVALEQNTLAVHLAREAD